MERPGGRDSPGFFLCLHGFGVLDGNPFRFGSPHNGERRQTDGWVAEVVDSS